jgi:hypothetical protein
MSQTASPNMRDWTKLKVPELKAELKNRGLSRNGRKAALVARLQHWENYESFTLFPKLPPELRDLIWKEALPGRRLISVEVTDDEPGSVGVMGEIPPDLFNVMQTCKESYAIVSKRLWPNLDPSHVVDHHEKVKHPNFPDATYDEDGFREPRWRLNHHDDVFLFQYPRQCLAYGELSCFMDRIETVGMEVGNFINWINHHFVPEHFAKLSSLRELVLFDKHHHPPELENSNPYKLLNSTHTPRGSYYETLAKSFRDAMTEHAELENSQQVQLLFAQDWLIYMGNKLDQTVSLKPR